MQQAKRRTGSGGHETKVGKNRNNRELRHNHGNVDKKNCIQESREGKGAGFKARVSTQRKDARGKTRC